MYIYIYKCISGDLKKRNAFKFGIIGKKIKIGNRKKEHTFIGQIHYFFLFKVPPTHGNARTGPNGAQNFRWSAAASPGVSQLGAYRHLETYVSDTPC